MNLANHPCFNDKIRHTFGRVHLPVAPRCNIQCKFCNRKFDCVNESRPGVTSGILSPYQAFIYLEYVLKKKQNISVVGIAGPGDPFANPEETMETLRLVRKKYPDMILCLATNGLNIAPYLDEIATLNVSHVTITVNAIDPEIGEKIYSWVRYKKRVRRADEGFKILYEKQIEAIKGLKQRNITVKVNSIIIPGINDEHIQAVAKKMSELDVNIMNCIPYYQNKGSAFENIEEPSKKMVSSIRKEASKYIKMMHHCTRCRADAVGLLGEAQEIDLMNKLKECEAKVQKPDNFRPHVAVASMEGMLVNQHLGQADQLFIYGQDKGSAVLIDTRKTPEPGTGLERWEKLSETINDCGTLLVSGIGDSPKQLLRKNGINIFEMQGFIQEAVQGIFKGASINHMLQRERPTCERVCSGTGEGCG
ncbi:FeMo cofactor biosynthesis protein NifB [Candidatus Magnetomoraceae bacterium gMMP-15]